MHIDDNSADLKLTSVALNNSPMVDRVHTATSGSQALEYLEQTDPMNPERRPPDLILLDLNMPGMSGIEVLKRLKNDERFKTIPVIILSSSDDAGDVTSTYTNHANCYVTKPTDLSQFVATVKVIEKFWIATVQLPVPEIV